MRGVNKAWRQFAGDEHGVTTIEWIAITSVALVAALAIATWVMNGASALGTAVGNQMNNAANPPPPP